MKFEKNVGKIDRLIRAVFGVLFILAGLLYFALPGNLISIFVGLVLIATALSGFCSVYSVLGIKTSGHSVIDVELGEISKK